MGFAGRGMGPRLLCPLRISISMMLTSQCEGWWSSQPSTSEGLRLREDWLVPNFKLSGDESQLYFALKTFHALHLITDKCGQGKSAACIRQPNTKPS